MSQRPEDHPPALEQALAILYVEDSAQDVANITRQLEKAGYKTAVDVAWEPEAFLKALRSKPYDVVLSDYHLPAWRGTEALRLLRQEDREIPFILVTGTLGEETAVECIKLGATDYVLKDRPARLSLAIKRALEERAERDQRRQAEQMRDRLAAIVESSEDAIISVTAEGAIVSWNSGATRIFGYGADEMVGRALSQLFAPDRLSEVEESLARLRNGQSTERHRIEGITKVGASVQLAVATSALRDPDGTISGGSAIVRDITQYCRLEELLRHSQKMDAIGRLAGGIAHDFNNVLTVILGYSSVIRKRLHPNDALLRTVLEIQRAAEQAALLTGQLLAFSRKRATEPRILDLNVLVDEMKSMLERLIGEELELQVVTSGSLLVKADDGQIRQVLMNLVANARDAMPLGGKIVVETAEAIRTLDDVGPMGKRAAGRYVTLAVTDAGTGIDAETQLHIFEPFFTTKDTGKGTGLGLATVYGIVQEHSGWIDVCSEPEQGTTFTVYIPAVAGAVEGVAPASAGAARHTRRATILLVEDQAPVRMLFEEVLSESGHKVLAASDGVAALELANRNSGSIDLLITDVTMPKMNGTELAGHLSRLWPGMIVLYMSGYSDQALLFKGRIEAGTAFLQKPFPPESLLTEVERLLSRASAACR